MGCPATEGLGHHDTHWVFGAGGFTGKAARVQLDDRGSPEPKPINRRTRQGTPHVPHHSAFGLEIHTEPMVKAPGSGPLDPAELAWSLP